MRRNLWAASIVAMTLVAGGAFAQEYPTPEEPAAEAAAPQLPEEVLSLINDKRPAQELSDDELKNRAKQARRFVKAKGLPQDVQDQLQALADADRAELEARAKAAEQAPAPEQPVQEQATEQPAAEQPAEAPKAAEAPPLPEEVQSLLADGRAVGDLSVEELKARQQTARKFSKDENLPNDVRQQLAEIGKQARQELVKREAAQQSTEPPAQEQAAPEQPEQPAQPQQEQAAPVQPEQPVEQPSAEAPAEQPAAPAADKAQVQQLDGNQGNPELEEKAKALLADETPADQLDDEKLRLRLDAMRDVMESNELSRDTERALRKKLRADREVLRDRLAKVKAEEEAKAAAEAAKKAAEEGKTDGQASTGEKPRDPVITAETPRRKILEDRRRSDDLDDNELRLRIKVYLDFEQDPSYQDFDEDQRSYWRDTVRRDRERLRRLMEEERNIRRVELEEDESNIERIEIDDENYSDDEEYDDVFAAEVDEEDIERVLIAPPKKKLRRVASVEEIERDEELRNSLHRIEIDTIHFGFNEAFVREEEIDNLDEIAQVMEKVLKKYPRETFLVEGHTDAVGSDAYNNKLSKARAEAVKKALSTFYLIPARNLQTAGLGERYLKIPTAEAEGENRRVSISRATAVLGEAEEE
jgi:outer membrane protein OmpA-like peptidoglycan-associated protein